MAQAVECLHKVLSSSPSTVQKIWKDGGVSELEDSHSNQSEQQREKRLKYNEQTLPQGL
jgi:hypothetical protein